MHLAHLEEESAERDMEVESEDTDSINGVTKEFMVHIARAVKDAQVEEKCCYHCSSLDHFICNYLLVRALRENMQLNHKEGTASKKGAQTPQMKMTIPKNPQGRFPRHNTSHADSLLESTPLSVLAGGHKCAQGEDQWGELHGSPRQWHANQYHHA